MAATSILAYIQDNPTIIHAGTKEAKATKIRGFAIILYSSDPETLDDILQALSTDLETITSNTDYENEVLFQRLADLGYGGLGTYATVMNSAFPSFAYQIQRAEGGDVITVSANDSTVYEDVLSVGAWELKIFLPFRTNYKVRVSLDGITWTDWMYFKTRDTTYGLPDAINQPRVNPVTGIEYTDHGATVTSTNVGKSTVTPTAEGATVVNTDTGSNQTVSISYTDHGATIINKEDIFA